LIFIDSNIPMYLVGEKHPNKTRARELLDDCFDNNERLVTDVEVLQEILHRYDSIRRRDAIQPAFDLLEDMVDEVYAVDPEDVESAKEILLANERLSARDSLHLSVMRRYAVDRVMTFDEGFDLVPDVVRIY
jgi:predicted nucleic acid-binding protein